MKNIAILGSTGSVGVSTLDVVSRHPERFSVSALTANTEVDRLFEQCVQFSPRLAVMADCASAEQLERRIKAKGLAIEVLGGAAALERVAALPEVDTVMASIVGAAGLASSLAAATAGKRILLANKEALVMSGHLFMRAVSESGATLLPIDSEHNAIFQALPDRFTRDLHGVGVQRILLTASGGPFRTRALAELDDITPDEACAHPTWVMGRKISVDSATMMNKGLEVIEAHWLFNAAPDQIEIVIHPQSVIHSLVQYVDGSVLAQLGNPDMRTPIAYGLAYPDRIDAGVRALDLFELARLDFERPDAARFPCIRLAYEALRHGGTAPCIMNAANEIAVQQFLSGALGFRAIPDVIEAVLNEVPASDMSQLSDVTEADAVARSVATEVARHRFGHATLRHANV